MTPRILALVIVAMTVSGCAQRSLSGDVYSRSDAKKAYRVEYGEVTEVRPIYIEGEATAFGTFGGYIIGYQVGREAANGGGVGAAVGGVAGALAGRVVEKSVSGEPGLEITVQLNRGGIVTVVQADDVQFDAGDDVRVLFARRGEARVQQKE